MDIDYPAAHSMDTAWFAVDSDGHVGFFDSGHPGPVPAAAKFTDNCDIQDHLKTLFLAAPALLLANSEGPSVRHILDAIPPGPWWDWRRVGYEHRRRQLQSGGKITDYYLRSIGMLLRSRRLLDDLPNSPHEVGQEFVTPDGPLIPVYFLRLDPQAYRQLHEAQECRACVDLGNCAGANPQRLGFYIYDAHDHHEHGPYELQSAPIAPLVVDQLPPEAKELIDGVQFNARFEKTKFLQPIEHVPCRLHGLTEEGGTFLAADLHTRLPVPKESLEASRRRDA